LSPLKENDDEDDDDEGLGKTMSGVNEKAQYPKGTWRKELRSQESR
jgi:hypothetical protein